MSKRLLLAVDAVRGTTSGEERGPACYTRARVLAAVRQHERRRVLNLAFGIPLAAVLMGSVAWAASGQQLTVMVRRLSAAITQEGSSRGASAASRASKPTRAVRLPTPTPTTTPNLQETHAVTLLDGERVHTVPVASTIHTTSTADMARRGRSLRGDEVSERELLLYESAHRAHFIDKNWAEALAHWDAYLHQLPRGRFAVEAAYNRALCLLRLGHTDKAIRALKPFAQGAPGGYRQREAQTLLDELEHGEQ